MHVRAVHYWQCMHEQCVCHSTLYCACWVQWVNMTVFFSDYQGLTWMHTHRWWISVVWKVLYLLQLVSTWKTGSPFRDNTSTLVYFTATYITGKQAASICQFEQLFQLWSMLCQFVWGVGMRCVMCQHLAVYGYCGQVCIVKYSITKPTCVLGVDKWFLKTTISCILLKIFLLVFVLSEDLNLVYCTASCAVNHSFLSVLQWTTTGLV